MGARVWRHDHCRTLAGKLVHSGSDQLSGSDYSLVDYNRAGVPLLEVVSDPDMRTGAEAAAYASELRRIMLFMGLTEGVMAEGHMRFDVNVSVSLWQTQQASPFRWVHERKVLEHQFTRGAQTGPRARD